MYKLTPKEYEIIKYTGQGLTNKQIAERMNMSEISIKKYLAKIYEKIGVDGKKYLLIFALKNNIQ